MKNARARWKLFAAIAIPIVTAAALIVGLVAWRSSDSSDSTASTGAAEEALLTFAQCMRANGVPTFPDPVARADGTFGFGRPTGVSPEALDAALEGCQEELRATGLSLDPGGAAPDAAAQDVLLEFSRCMRKNGIAEFPDPDPSGGFHGLFEGIDPQSPRVQEALQGCQSFLGQIFGHGG